MPKVASSKIVVVFEQELINAAKALQPFATKDAKTTSQDVEKALRACFAAIYSPELASGEHPITVCRKHDLSA